MAIVTRAGKGAALTHTEMDNNLTELNTRPDGQTFPSDPTVGIKISGATPDWGWVDLLGTLITVDGTATETVYIGNIKQPQFAEGDDAYISFHMPHDYVLGSEMYIHIHWSHNTAIVTGGTVTWAFETTYSKGHNQDYFRTPVIITVASSGSTIPYQHIIAETVATTPGGSAVLLNTNDMEIDGIIICRIYLDSNDLLTTGATVNPFVHYVDLHYQSTGIGTKNKAPNFYS